MSTGSPEVHAAIEESLVDLCDRAPLSALCLDDRGSTTAPGRLDDAITWHRHGLRERSITVRHDDDTLWIAGEVDMSNIDVLTAALRAISRTASPTVRIDVHGVTFLSGEAGRALYQQTADYRDRGGHVELHGARPHLARILRVIQPRPLPGFEHATPGR